MKEGRKEGRNECMDEWMDEWINSKAKEVPMQPNALQTTWINLQVRWYEDKSGYKILQRLHVHGGVRFQILQDHQSKPSDTWDSLGINISWPPETARVGMQRDFSWNLWTRGSWKRSCGKCQPYIPVVEQTMLQHEVLIFIWHPNAHLPLGDPTRSSCSRSFTSFCAPTSWPSNHL